MNHGTPCFDASYVTVMESDLNKEWQDRAEPEEKGFVWICRVSDDGKSIKVEFGGQMIFAVMLERRTVIFSEIPASFYMNHISLFAKYVPELLIRILHC